MDQPSRWRTASYSKIDAAADAFNDVICWAYEEDFKKVFNAFKEEDDF